MANETAYPLCWPAGWKRTPEKLRRRADFRTGGRTLLIADGVARVLLELDRQGVNEDAIVISSNIKPQLGRMADTSPQDPGVAVYWPRNGKQSCMAVDCYSRVADNLAGVAITLQYMRGIERHGGAEILERAFLGFQSLPPPNGRRWQDVLGVYTDCSLDSAEVAYRTKAKQFHPDTNNGDHDKMSELNEAIRQAREALS